MKDEILAFANDPGQLEKMYRTNKASFRREFNTLYPGLKGSPLADFWNERLNYEGDEMVWGTRAELFFVLMASLVAGFIAKIPGMFPVSEEFFYPRNIGFIFLPLLTAYFAWKNSLPVKRAVVIFGVMLASLAYINLLPASTQSDTLLLACIHLPLLLWMLLGASFMGSNLADHHKRLDFLKYNGDLAVMTALILIAGGIMTGITIGLFSVAGFNIGEFYFENVVVFGLPAAPIAGTFLIQANPQLVGRVSPVIARIFSPLVLVMLGIYLAAMAFSGKDPYSDREFLVIFNALLIGVMAIIFFSIAGISKTRKSRAEVWILFLLSALTIIVNGIALSAILFRISEWGITPNRIAVLGGNVLILVNLILVTVQLSRVLWKKGGIEGVGRVIALYLPVYFVWAAVVTFLFPLIFGFN
jgi:hypothetical protein